MFRWTLLVVMPNGFGVARVGAGSAGGGDALAGVAALGAGPALGRAASDILSWLAFAVGAILIAAAWTISLRLRPPRRRDGVASAHGS